MEAELLWPRVWQMACRLEEIPQPHDFVEYEFLDQSVIVLRTDDMGVRAFQNACRHRGVKVVEGRGHVRERVHLPVPRLVLRPRRHEHRASRGAKTFAEHNLQPDDIDLVPGAVRDVGRVRVDQPRRRRPAAAAVHRAVRDDPRRVEGGVAADRVVVRVPAPGELEARDRGVRRDVPRGARRIPQLVIPGTRYALRDGAPFDPRAFIDADIQYLRTMSDGMAGMVHANDVRVAEGLRDIELPADPTLGDRRPGTARSTTRS